MTDFNDFLFIGHGGGSSGTSGAEHCTYNLRVALGVANSHDNMGYTGQCAAILNSGLSNPLPNSIAGTYARGMKVSQGSNDTDSVRQTARAMLFDPAAGGSKYPTNNVGGSDQIAYSLRAFLRLDDPNSQGTSTKIGANVGLAHKVQHDDGSSQYRGCLLYTSPSPRDKR